MDRLLIVYSVLSTLASRPVSPTDNIASDAPVSQEPFRKIFMNKNGFVKINQRAQLPMIEVTEP